MKKLILITLFCTGMTLFNDLSAQAVFVPPPSDAPKGYTYLFDQAKQLIIERQIKPASNNRDVQPIIDSKDFPKLQSEKDLNKTYDEKLKSWMEKNPDIIIGTLKPRKEIVQQY